MSTNPITTDDKEAREARAWHFLALARDNIAALPQAARTYQLQRIDATIDEFGKQEYERRMRLNAKYPPPTLVSPAVLQALDLKIERQTTEIDELRAKLATYEPPPPPAPDEKSVAQPIAQE